MLLATPPAYAIRRHPRRPERVFHELDHFRLESFLRQERELLRRHHRHFLARKREETRRGETAGTFRPSTSKSSIRRFRPSGGA